MHVSNAPHGSLRLAIWAVLCAGAASSLVAQGYRYRVVDLDAARATARSDAVDLDARGNALVISRSRTGMSETFVFDTDRSALVPVGAPTAGGSFSGQRMNDRGQVVGIAHDARKRTLGLYLHTPGKGFQSLGRLIPSGPVARACGLNGRGEVVGSAQGLTGMEPFLWTPKLGMRSLAPFGSGYLCGLNDRGEAVGRIGNDWGLWIRSSGAHGIFAKLPFEATALRADGHVLGYDRIAKRMLVRDPFGGITWLPSPNVVFTGLSPLSFNGAGIVAGYWTYYKRSGSSRIFRTGAMLRLPSLGTRNLSPANNGFVDPAWEVVLLTRVNELGQIVGTARRRPAGVKHAVRLDPVSPSAAVKTVGQGCGPARPPALTARRPVLGPPLRFALAGAQSGARGALLLGLPARAPILLPGGCRVYLDVALPVFALALTTDARGAWAGKLDVEPRASYLGATLAAQAAVLGARGLELSAALHLTLGF